MITEGGKLIKCVHFELGQERDPNAAWDIADKTHPAPTPDEACVCGEVVTQNSKRAQVLTRENLTLSLKASMAYQQILKDRKYFWA